jgi:hypothetical protein
MDDQLAWLEIGAVVLVAIMAVGIGAYLGYRNTRWLFPARHIPPNPARLRQELPRWGISSLLTFTLALGAEIVLGVDRIFIALTVIAVVYSLGHVLFLIVVSKRTTASQSGWGKKPPQQGSV